ncbi:MAG: creatininase family protein [Lachnospiraceae bacterium]
MVYRISDMTWMEFEERSKTEKSVILVSGAIEAYGPHLPMDPILWWLSVLVRWWQREPVPF